MNSSKLFLSILGISLLMVACVNSDYDWDNIDKTVDFNVGNVPLGNVEKLFLDSLLPEKLLEQMKVGDDGTYFVDFNFDLDVEIPEIEVPEIETVNITPITIDGIPSFYIPIPGGSLAIVNDAHAEYRMEKPEFSGDGWHILVESMLLKEASFVTNIQFSGINIEDPNNAASVEITLVLPEEVKIKGSDSRTIKREISWSQFNNGVYSFQGDDIINLESFTYIENHDLQINYSVILKGGADTKISSTTGSFSFSMSFETVNIIPDVIYGEVDFSETISDIINDLDVLGDSFSADDRLIFSNPVIEFDLETNIGFDLGLNLSLEASNSYETIGTEPINLIFKAAELGEVKKSSYLLGLKNEAHSQAEFVYFDMNPIMDIKPNQVSYTARAHNEGVNKRGFVMYENSFVRGNCTVRAPFKFTDLSVKLDETIEDLFDEDTADIIFNSEGKYIIAADEVVVDLKEGNALELVLGLSLLDNNWNTIDVEVTPITLSHGNHDLALEINVEEADIERMKDLRHLRFDFEVRNKNGQEAFLAENFSILMNGLKFKSTAGISTTFE
ncbi:hypothetical protein LJC06_02530 [Bacteroidales bacterium OttesenSCG-928-I14]|nr:hypothetical protein [Bacteroidales bacterium OttesenSCG-928-I14]